MYRILKYILGKLFYGVIFQKKIKGFNKILSYEPSQHLTFFLMRKIDYERNVWSHINKFIQNSELIFDIGGNIGQYALRFSESIGDKGKILSIEPDSKNWAYLNFNLAINFCQNVEVLRLGLSDKVGVETFWRDVNNGGRLGSFIKNESATVPEVVKITTLDNLIFQYGIPDFIKVDVEGFEVTVIKGLSNFDKKIKFLIEVREDTKNEIFHIFQNRGFKCYLVDKREIITIRNSVEIPYFADLLFIYE